MANLVTNKCKFELFTGAADLDAADLRMLLLKGGTPTADTNFVDDLTPASNELTVSGYARATLSGSRSPRTTPTTLLTSMPPTRCFRPWWPVKRSPGRSCSGTPDRMPLHLST